MYRTNWRLSENIEIRRDSGRRAAAPSHIIEALSVGPRAFSTLGLSPRTLLRNPRQNHRRTIGEFSHQRQLSAHRLDGLPQRGEQQIAELFKPRNAVLGDPASLGHARSEERRAGKE